MDTSSLMEQILSNDNLNRAYLQVVRNKGAEGVDGMKYTELKEYLAKNGEIIKEQLRIRKYKPQPVRRVEIPKPDGGVRNLGVPTVTDRFIQQAIHQEEAATRTRKLKVQNADPLHFALSHFHDNLRQ